MEIIRSKIGAKLSEKGGILCYYFFTEFWSTYVRLEQTWDQISFNKIQKPQMRCRNASRFQIKIYLIFIFGLNNIRRLTKTKMQISVEMHPNNASISSRSLSKEWTIVKLICSTALVNKSSVETSISQYLRKPIVSFQVPEKEIINHIASSK